MKRVLMLTVGLVLLVFLVVCSSESEKNIYDVYTFDEVSYLSPLSSSTKDYVNSQMEETIYAIKEDLFKIESTEYTVEFTSPKYVKEEISKESSLLSDVYTFIGSDVDYQYSIYDNDGNKSKWRLYVSSDSLWIATYNDSTANGSEVIMYIYRLSK
ncbi:hypothetical protein [Tissierella sp.]|uniref:hypothetical protein n=1 Tax=Tissierella sp. TaxID=41274 RepID=UPI00285F1686|nr:hypothetical protein [Tissierella sp.]MDR7855372.1 hypothetical protein [Tissierella sp.]